MIRTGAELSGDLHERAQVVVVGSGAGGAVLAKELAAHGVDVVMLEEGPRVDPTTLGGRPIDHIRKLYRDAGTAVTVGTPAIALPTGRALGGTTVINSGTCFRLPERTWERWRQEIGVTSFAEGDLAPYFDAVEAAIGVAPADPEVAGVNATLFRKGAERLGYHGHWLRRNTRDCVGTGLCALGCPTGAKQSMERTYIPRASELGARIYADCRVDDVLVSGGRAAGVRGVVMTSAGPREVIVHADVTALCCGAIGTPVLLQKTRLLESRHVGRHLHIHPATKAFARFPEPIHAWRGIPQSYCVDALHDRGILIEGAFVPPELGAMGLPYGPRHVAAMREWERLSSYGLMVTDSSEGRVRLGLGGLPLMRYDLDRADTARFHEGLAVLAEIYFAAGAEEVYPGLDAVPVLTSAAEIERIRRLNVRAQDLDLLAFHPMGTCRLAERAADGVVDPNLESWELPGLFVVDASVFPSSLGVNPQLSIMAFAHRAADYLASRRTAAGAGVPTTVALV